MKCDELKRFDIVGKYSDEETMYEFRPDGECYDADEVDAAIAELKDENRRLKRALWLAREERARSSALSYHLIESHPDRDTAATYKRKANKWEKAKDKCLKKAKEYL